MNWRQIFLNRFVVTFGAIGIAIGLWNGYISMNNQGYVEGMVVDGAGMAVADAKVVLSRSTVMSVDILEETQTDEQGWFSFGKHDEYSLILIASKGELDSEKIKVPLWFRNQNVSLSIPIVIEE